ncbi:MAG: tungsten ABC transporter substrate-binding protein [Gemmatales bacterium]|nr:MAG: tungsten ABC transporter substrate-binding protein [Gemmatales bacterium]
MKRLRRMLFLVGILAGFSSGCAGNPTQTGSQAESITLATTTSTRDSGLLDRLLPVFRRQTGIEVKVVAVGTGQAIELGRRGDADVLLTHAPDAEKAFMAEGWGKERRPVMHNDFILAGPKDDPAGLIGAREIVEAFSKIAAKQAPFVSRGDESGTHRKELDIWKKAKIEPTGPWYIRAGAGMARALRIASEKRAYILADRGTFLALRDELDLTIVSSGDPMLRNDYSVILLNEERHPHVHVAEAKQFADFLTAAETKALIGEFGVDKFGQPLFVPAP